MRVANMLAAALCLAAVGAGLWHYHDMGLVRLEGARVEGQVRVITSPGEASVLDVPVREGDSVAAGDVLLRLAMKVRDAVNMVPGYGPRGVPDVGRGAGDAEAYSPAREREARHAWQAARQVEDAARRQLEAHSTAHARSQVVLRGMGGDSSVSQAARQRAAQDEREARTAYERARLAAEEASTLRAEAESEWRRLHAQADMPAPFPRAGDASLDASPPTVSMRAEVPGVVVRRSVQSGEQVTGGQPLLLLVPVRAEHLWIVGRMPAGRASLVRPGMACAITLEGRPDVTLTGRVVNVEERSVVPGKTPRDGNRTGGAVAVSPGAAGGERPGGRTGEAGDRTADAGNGARGPWVRVALPLAAGAQLEGVRYGMTAEVVVLVREPLVSDTGVAPSTTTP